MPPISEKIIRYTVSLVLTGLTLYLGYFVQRADFLPFISAYGVFFGLYVWLIFFQKDKSQTGIRWYIGLGIALRILLLFSIPNLSDDFYRFLWDGRLAAGGIDPFSHPPAYFIENQIFPTGITPELFGKLNSPEYFTVYPPVCQAVFALAGWLSPGNEWNLAAGKPLASEGVVVMKLFLLACEVGTIFQLAAGSSNKQQPSSAPIPDLPCKSAICNLQSAICNLQLFYALNPLVILEITGNCHFEGAMIFFLIAGMRALQNNKVKTAAAWWALATAAKLLPLMFLPIILRRLGWRRGLIFNAVFAPACLILFTPLLGVLPNIFSSLDLYFRQFQFNASVYYVLREILFWIKGYDVGETLGPFLGLMTIGGVLILTWMLKPSRFSKSGRFALDFTDALLFALILQLSFSATVHPWYVAVPFAISLLTRWRFPLIWTGLVVLSYSHYAGGQFQENYWLIALEYSVLWVFIIWEIKQRNTNSGAP